MVERADWDSNKEDHKLPIILVASCERRGGGRAAFQKGRRDSARSMLLLRGAEPLPKLRARTFAVLRMYGRTVHVVSDRITDDYNRGLAGINPLDFLGAGEIFSVLMISTEEVPTIALPSTSGSPSSSPVYQGRSFTNLCLLQALSFCAVPCSAFSLSRAFRERINQRAHPDANAQRARSDVQGALQPLSSTAFEGWADQADCAPSRYIEMCTIIPPGSQEIERSLPLDDVRPSSLNRDISLCLLVSTAMSTTSSECGVPSATSTYNPLLRYEIVTFQLEAINIAAESRLRG